MRPLANKQSPIRWIGAIAALLAVGAMWIELAPTKLGGSAEYAVIDGISMEPHLHHGDLVLLHPTSSYQVGDVVGYHNLMLGRLVLHRIVGEIGGRYVFKGDNNSFLDAYHPTQNQLVGRLWFKIPSVGNVFTWLHQPHHAALGGVLLALALAGGGAGAHRRRRHRRKTVSRKRRTVTANPVLGRKVMSAAAIGAAAFGLVSLLAFTHAKTTTVDAPGAYTQEGTYAYSADAQRGTVYPTGHITTGQTVFTRLAKIVRPTFDYRFVTALPHSVHGTARLQATLQSSTGWTKTLPFSSPVQFQGDHVLLAGELDLASLEQQTQQYFKLTGVPTDSFTVVVTPSVDVTGQVGSHAINDSFAPTPMSFVLDGYSLRLEQATLGAQVPGTPTADPLHPSAPGVIPSVEPAQVKLLVPKLRVSAARALGIAGLAGSALLALAGLLLMGRRRDDELASIQRRDGDLLVPLSSPPAEPAGGYVDVANFDSLAHLARSYDRVILHHQDGDAHSFYIDDDGSVYRYRLRVEAA